MWYFGIVAPSDVLITYLEEPLKNVARTLAMNNLKPARMPKTPANVWTFATTFSACPLFPADKADKSAAWSALASASSGAAASPVLWPGFGMNLSSDYA